MALGKIWAISLIVSILFLGALTPGLMFQNSFAQSGGTDKITICHYPPGNPQNPQTISVSIKSLKAHEGHGDTIGPCVVTQCPDSDGDGVCDQVCVGEDLCPTDPAKASPGVCGCGLADTDSDGDGTADCVDVCIDDASNDSDQDGFCPSDGDCDDQNPNSYPGNLEVCDGFDNNCNGTADEGTGGAACNSGLPGACSAGTTSCEGGVLVCTPTTEASPETCDNLDNDCDGQTDEGNPGGGASCGTGLPGVCFAGTTSCQGGTIVCSQTTQPSPETCNGLDDDCNGVVDEGIGGTACSTGLPGVCSAGVSSCQGGTIVCTPITQPFTETCNGIDDDCDGQTDEGNPGGGAACSTGLPGVCSAGVSSCQGGTLVCSQTTQPSAEICDSIDQDCDGNISEGACTLPNAASTCSVGACQVTNCNPGFANCDSNPANGCETNLNLNPSCGSATDIGSIRGDTGADTITVNSIVGEKWFRFFVSEADSSPTSCHDLGARISIAGPSSGQDYDLFAYCDGCTTVATSSTTSGSSNEQVIVRWEEDGTNVFGQCIPSGSDSGRFIIVEVRHAFGNSCQSYSLTVTGNTIAGPLTCGSK